jgi:hypothetical protein
MLNSNIILLIVLILIINSFFIGYLLGRFNGSNGVSNSKQKSFFQQQDSKAKEINTISIDDKKFVVDIKTEGLEKKYDSLGDVKTTQDNISNSVNKLKNLKR